MIEHVFVQRSPAFLHADLDSFYASVEQRDDPALRGRPVAVGGGVILAASYEAKARGVRTAMSGRAARRLCPGLVVVAPRMSAYVEASRAVFDVFHDTSPLVEGISIDEAFLDVSGLTRLAGSPAEVAARLRVEVRDRVDLPITVGVAATKFLAKIASAVGKPDGLLVVEPGAELDFLHPLPVERLWGVGATTSVKLRERGVITVGDIARVGQAAMVAMLGNAHGRHLYALSRNLDPRPVVVGRRRASVGAQHALGISRYTPEAIHATLIGLVDRVARRMRGADRVGRTVTIRLRFGDLGRATRSRTLPQATAQTDLILAAAQRLVADAAPIIDERGLTLLGVAVSSLRRDAAVQLTLPLPPAGGADLDSAVDAVRAKFGTSAVTRAVLVRDAAMTGPTLPEMT